MTNSTMNTLQTILGALCLISGVAYAIVATSNGVKKSALRVGDVFVHGNPGKHTDPREAPSPFALIYTVKEITGDGARLEKHWIESDGTTMKAEAWETAGTVGVFDKRILRGPEPRN